MWDFIRENPFVAGALTGSVAAYLLGLLISYLRREKRWIGYQVSRRNIVEGGPSKLEVSYAGRSISRLDSQLVQVRNIGNRPLVDQPVQISIANGEIADCELSLPDGAVAQVATPEPHMRTVTFDLLNPGEALNIGVTVIDGHDEPVSVVARGELLEVRQIGDRIASEELMEILLPSIPLIGALSLDLLRVTRRLGRR